MIETRQVERTTYHNMMACHHCGTVGCPESHLRSGASVTRFFFEADSKYFKDILVMNFKSVSGIFRIFFSSKKNIGRFLTSKSASVCVCLTFFG